MSRRIIRDEESLSCTDWTSSFLPKDASISRRYLAVSRLTKDRWRVGVLPDGDGIFVEDDGPGIPVAERDAVFEAGHTTKEDGTGFGLATVNQLVEGHGWDIRITDGDSDGARFEISGI
ncbi:ATP-binding protein [Halorubrum sp. CSM-61]|uniref:ATP-binding protein n=1 Tax=Halorubrum sp. CSM-61 TaxID=2485838 RepID=UPI0019D0DD7B|nr:HAMP domain-containing sensor histidine kinase [Halorubrum sp. CSM-61]